MKQNSKMNNKTPTPPVAVDTKKLTKADVGRWVKYHSFGDNYEMGRIKSWNDEYVFVVYPGNNDAKKDHYDRYTAAATKPEDLTFN